MTRTMSAALGAILLAVTGCASVPMAAPELDRAAKQFPPPPPGRSQIYVYRNEVLGSAVRVFLGGRHTGKLSALEANTSPR